MDRRLDLQAELEKVIGNQNVYFQPPESVKLSFPCIVYKLGTASTQYANDMPYIFKARYEVTAIHKDPDDSIFEKLAMHFPYCKHDRTFTSGNMYHDVFELYF